MYVFISSEWGLALHEFTDLLVKHLGKNAVMVVGLDGKMPLRSTRTLCS